jgi:hypothetical protein
MRYVIASMIFPEPVVGMGIVGGHGDERDDPQQLGAALINVSRGEHIDGVADLRAEIAVVEACGRIGFVACFWITKGGPLQ